MQIIGEDCSIILLEQLAADDTRLVQNLVEQRFRVAYCSPMLSIRRAIRPADRVIQLNRPVNLQRHGEERRDPGPASEQALIRSIDG